MKEVKPWKGKRLEIPVIYRFYGQRKLVNWLIMKTEAVKKELECKVSKCMKYILRKPFNFVIFSIQFVIFKPLSYCFKEIIGFDVKASFASRP